MRGKLSLFTLALALVALLPDLSFAFTNTNGAEFQSLYDTVVGWVTGIPGIIMAIGVGIVGAWRAFASGQFLWFFGGLLVAAIILLLPTIVNGMGFVY